jgi:hypothetical protein
MASLAIAFILIGQGLSLSLARRLVKADAVLGVMSRRISPS